MQREKEKMNEFEELKKALKTLMSKHLSDGEIVRYHDDICCSNSLRQRIELHLELCNECRNRFDGIANLIHLTEQEMMDYHEGIIKNPLTLKRVNAHLFKSKCPRCKGWLGMLRQAQEDTIKLQAEDVPQIIDKEQQHFLNSTLVISEGEEEVGVPLLELAASEDHSTEEERGVQERPFLDLVGSFVIENVNYEVYTDSDGNIYLYSSQFRESASLILVEIDENEGVSEVSYNLGPVLRVEGGKEIRQVTNLGRGTLELFLAHRRRNLTRYQIRLE
jgi:hypothetical protein